MNTAAPHVAVFSSDLERKLQLPAAMIAYLSNTKAWGRPRTVRSMNNQVREPDTCNEARGAEKHGVHTLRADAIMKQIQRGLTGSLVGSCWLRSTGEGSIQI